MIFILTNDDGIHAPGLARLADIFKPLGRVIVAAPNQEKSGISHCVTAYQPIEIKKIKPDWFAVDGTPADCTRVGLKHIAPDASWVIAGINPGANLGSDVYNSGTVAAAREAAILGCRSMAVSQYISQHNQIDWEITQYHAQKVIKKIIEKPLLPRHFWNINLPHPLIFDITPDIKFCPLDTNPHSYIYKKEDNRLIYQGIIHDRPRNPNSDVDLCFSGNISVSQIALAL